MGLAAADKRATIRFFCSFGNIGASANIASKEASVAVSVFMTSLSYTDWRWAQILTCTTLSKQG
jgi:hypothetical protein